MVTIRQSEQDTEPSQSLNAYRISSGPWQPGLTWGLLSSSGLFAALWWVMYEMLAGNREAAIMRTCMLALLSGVGCALACRMQERRRMASGVLLGTLLGTLGLVGLLFMSIIGGAIRG